MSAPFMKLSRLNAPRPRPFDNSDYRVTRTTTPDGSAVINIHTPAGTAGAHITADAKKELPNFATLETTVGKFGDDLSTAIENLRPEKIPAEAARLAKNIAQAFRNALGAATRYQQQFKIDRAGREEFPQNDRTLALDMVALDHWRKLPHAEKIKAIGTLPQFAIFAIAKAGFEMSGLKNSDEWSMVLRRVRYWNMRATISKAEENPNFRIERTAENPLAYGVDETKLNQHLDDLDRMDKRKAAVIDDAARYLSQVVMIVAVSSGTGTDAAWRMLTGQADA